MLHHIVLSMMTSSNGNIFRVIGPFCEGNHRSPGHSPHRGQWSGVLVFGVLFDMWLNKRLNNMRRYSAHCDVTVCLYFHLWTWPYTDVHILRLVNVLVLLVCTFVRAAVLVRPLSRSLSLFLCLYVYIHPTSPLQVSQYILVAKQLVNSKVLHGSLLISAIIITKHFSGIP